MMSCPCFRNTIFPRSLDRSAGLFHERICILLSHVPNYLSFLDVMTVKKVLHEHEWVLFLEHISNNSVFVVRGWSKSYGNIEVLVHTKGPIDPGHTFKAEGDGSFDEATKKAILGFVIFVSGKLGYLQVIFEVHCSSSVEAELLANIALQNELIKLKLLRGVVWTDSEFCHSVMTGKHSIGINDPNRELLLLLRSLRLKFESLIPEWKPRQLLSLPDAIIRNCDSLVKREDVMRTLETLSPFLSGSPRFRLRWSKDAVAWRKDYVKNLKDLAHVPERSSSTYWHKVDDEESKLSMIVECIDLFKSDRLLLIIDRLEDKSEFFQREIRKIYKSFNANMWKIESYSGFICSPHENNPIFDMRDRLVIGCDASVPLEFYRTCETASTVIVFAQAHEVKKLEEAGVSEVNAEAYINFHNIKLTLKDSNLGKEGKKDSNLGKEGKKGNTVTQLEGKEGKKGNTVTQSEGKEGKKGNTVTQLEGKEGKKGNTVTQLEGKEGKKGNTVTQLEGKGKKGNTVTQLEGKGKKGNTVTQLEGKKGKKGKKGKGRR